MKLKMDAKFEDKLTCGLENDMRTLVNLHQNSRKCQIWVFHGIYLSKWRVYELKFYIRALCHVIEE